MLELKVWLGGEGATEVGSRHRGEDRVGAVEALLRKVEPHGWKVEGATLWSRIPKYVSKAALAPGENHGDTKNVIRLVQRASEHVVDIVAFCRDVDSDDEREAAIELGIRKASAEWPHIALIGGVAKPALEGWILALAGETGTDTMSRRRSLEKLQERGIPAKDSEAYVEVIEQSNLQRLRPGCDSLTRWVSCATSTFDQALRDAGAPTSDARPPT
jgi:hypothetical protein